MSYILDALKKVEHEKHKKSAPGGMTSIAGDLFQERIQRPASGGRWKIIMLILVVSLVTFAGTWFLLRDNKPKSNPLSGPVKRAVVVPAAPRADVNVSAPVPEPVQAVAVTPAAPSTANIDKDIRSSITVKKQTEMSVEAVNPLSLKPALQSVQPPADIKLSGIAWQDERSARRAVVNGFLLKEGSVVSGAKITEIMADRVRFVLPSGAFEVRLDAAPVAEVKR